MAIILVDAEDVKTGEVIECLIENTVRFGDKFKEGGRTLRRIPTPPRAVVKDDREFLAWNLPFEDVAKEQGRTLAEHYTKDGVAAFSTAKGRREFLAQHNDNAANGETLGWDR